MYKAGLNHSPMSRNPGLHIPDTMKMVQRSLHSRLERVLAHYRDGGIRRVLKHLAHYACSHHWMLWMADMEVLGLAGSTESPVLPLLPGYTFRFATETDLEAILACVPFTERSQLDKLFSKFFHNGTRCTVVLFESRVVGYLWAFTGEYVITLDDYRRCNLQVHLPAGTLFTGTAYVEPLHRGRGLYQRLTSYLVSEYPSGTSFYTSVSDLNAPSLAANRKLGFSTVATLRFIGVLSYKLLYIRETGGRRWYPLSTHWPVLRVEGMHLRIESPTQLPVIP